MLLAQGVPFIHAGQEFYRTKGLEDNTYNLPDSLNQLDVDWHPYPNCQEEIAFLEELIAYRKLISAATPSFEEKGKRDSRSLLWCQMVVWSSSSFNLHDWESREK